MIILLTFIFSGLAYISPIKAKNIYYISGILLLICSIFRAYTFAIGIPLLILGIRKRKIFYNINIKNINE